MSTGSGVGRGGGEWHSVVWRSSVGIHAANRLITFRWATLASQFCVHLFPLPKSRGGITQMLASYQQHFRYCLDYFNGRPAVQLTHGRKPTYYTGAWQKPHVVISAFTES